MLSKARNPRYKRDELYSTYPSVLARAGVFSPGLDFVTQFYRRGSLPERIGEFSGQRYFAVDVDRIHAEGLRIFRIVRVRGPGKGSHKHSDKPKRGRPPASKTTRSSQHCPNPISTDFLAIRHPAEKSYRCMTYVKREVYRCARLFDLDRGFSTCIDRLS